MTSPCLSLCSKANGCSLTGYELPIPNHKLAAYGIRAYGDTFGRIRLVGPKSSPLAAILLKPMGLGRYYISHMYIEPQLTATAQDKLKEDLLLVARYVMGLKIDTREDY